MSRIERVSALIKREIAEIISQKMDRSKVGFVSITDVVVSKDLHLAKVFYSQIGSDQDKNRTLRFLKQSSKYIKGELGRVIRLKSIPDLQFIYDESLERGASIIDSINHLHDHEH